MYEYAYITVEGRGLGHKAFDGHREIVDDYARRGYRLIKEQSKNKIDN